MIRSLSRLGLNVPDDVSVVGFGGISIGESLIPNLATAVQPAEAMGNWAATHLVSRIEEGPPVQNVVFPHYVRQGESWSKLSDVAYPILSQCGDLLDSRLAKATVS